MFQLNAPNANLFQQYNNSVMKKHRASFSKVLSAPMPGEINRSCGNSRLQKIRSIAFYSPFVQRKKNPNKLKVHYGTEMS